MSKEYSFNQQELQEKLLAGVKKLAALVSSTLGPRGQNVLLQEPDKTPFVTKDGVTVARFVYLDDVTENAGAQLLKQVAMQTNSDAGDGTTTATVLAANIFEEAQKYVAAGVAVNELKHGIEHAVSCIVEEIKKNSRPIKDRDDIARIATISANGDESIGDLIATAVDKIGKDGAITIEDAKSMETSLDIIEGFRFDSGYVASSFVTDQRRQVMKHDNVLILVTDEKIDRVKDIMPVLEIAARDKRPLIIVAEEIEGQALAACIMNAVGGTMKVAAIKAPRYGQERRNILKDLALSVGATLIARETGTSLNKVKLQDLGEAKFVESHKNFTTIVGGKGDFQQVNERIEALKSELTMTDSLQECERIQERITRLASGVAVIKVGGRTEVEMIEKRHRIEDALEAVKAAQSEGIIEGGGVALLLASIKASFDDENKSTGFKWGVNIVRKAVETPIRTIVTNAGGSADIVVQTISSKALNAFTREQLLGYDAAKSVFVNMFKSGIIDPCKVTRCALQNAASVAAALLMTKCSIIAK